MKFAGQIVLVLCLVGLASCSPNQRVKRDTCNDANKVTECNGLHRECVPGPTEACGACQKGHKEKSDTQNVGIECDEKTSCDELTKPANGEFKGDCKGNQITEGKKCTLMCDPGFKANGETELTCEPNFEWNKQKPTCEKKTTCDKLTKPANGNFDEGCEADKIASGKTCTLKCDPGYEVKGDNALTCKENFEWDKTKPSCEKKTKCDELTKPDNGKFEGQCKGDQNDPAKKCTLKCDHGYKVKGKTELSCEANFEWDNPIPSCEKDRCTKLDEPENGNFSGKCNEEKIEKNDNCTFKCNANYKLDGVSEVTCGDNYEWSNTKPPTCKPSDCQAFMNGTSGTTFEEYCSKEMHKVCKAEKDDPSCGDCKPGFKAVTNTAAACVAQKTTCVKLTKPDKGDFEGSCEADQINADQKCTFKCDSGYKVKGDNVLTCIADFVWDKPTPTCEKKSTCDKLTKPDKGNFDGDCEKDQINADQKCTFKCDSGYKVKGDNVLTCKPDFEWDKTKPSCESGAATIVAQFMTLLLALAFVGLKWQL